MSVLSIYILRVGVRKLVERAKLARPTKQAAIVLLTHKSDGRDRV